MTYLELVRKLDLILRIGTETPGTQPASIASADGVHAEMTQYIKYAHDDLCKSQTNWAFMRGSCSLSLPAGDRFITKAEMQSAYPTLGKVVPFADQDGGHIGMVATGVSGAAEVSVQYVQYQHWQGHYDMPPIETGVPTHFTITPDHTLEFNCIADREYTIRANYRKKVVTLSGDSDQPMMDEDYQNAIVWWAIVHYYCPSRDKTMELRQKADVELRRELRKLHIEQLPDFTIY